MRCPSPACGRRACPGLGPGCRRRMRKILRGRTTLALTLALSRKRKREKDHASGQFLEPKPMRPCRFVAEAPPLVFFVLAVIALEELDVRFALEREDVRRDAI